MLHQVQICLRILPINWFSIAHDLGAGLSKSIVTPLVFNPRGLLEEHFPQDFFFLVVWVVVLDVVVVRLVENCWAVVIAVRVLVSNPAHLVYDLRLGRVWAQWYLRVWPSQLWRLEYLTRVHWWWLRSEVLASKQQHLLVEAANHWNFRLRRCLFCLRLLDCCRCSCLRILTSFLLRLFFSFRCWQLLLLLRRQCVLSIRLRKGVVCL